MPRRPQAPSPRRNRGARRLPSALLLLALAAPIAAQARQPAVRALAVPVRLTTVGGTHPTVSPDGAWVVYSHLNSLYRIPAGGGDAQLLVGDGRDPDWSRTGSLILYRNDAGVHTVDALTLATATLSTDFGLEGGTWSPLGDEIAFQRNGNSLALLSWPGAQLTILSCADPDGSGCACEGPTWSADAQWLAFEDGTDILEVTRTGGTAVNVYQYVDGLDITQPAWSPDGRWIAVSRAVAAGSEYANIWVLDATGAAQGLHQVTEGNFSDSLPAWSPDGGTIYFSSGRSGSGQIWKVAAPAVATERQDWGSVKGAFR